MIEFSSPWKIVGVMYPYLFWDTLVIPQPDGGLTTTAYRKPTHTDLYLQWESHHTTAAKYSVVNTFYHRARSVCSKPPPTKEGERSSTDGPTTNQVPHMGSPQGENENQCTLQSRPKQKGHQQ